MFYRKHDAFICTYLHLSISHQKTETIKVQIATSQRVVEEKENKTEIRLSEKTTACCPVSIAFIYIGHQSGITLDEIYFHLSHRFYITA